MTLVSLSTATRLVTSMLCVVSVSVLAQKPLLKEPETPKTINGKTPQELRDSPNALERRIGYTLKSADRPFAIIPYENNYLLATLSSDVNSDPYKTGDPEVDRNLVDVEDEEIKFQVSLMFPIWRNMFNSNFSLIASYTQLSLWQAENNSSSAPFRETNYQPQIFANWIGNTKLLGLNWRWVEAGFNHQSNGRADEPLELSRSWNRLFASFHAGRGNFALKLRPWIIIGSTSDNKDIEDYMGYYDVGAAYNFRGNVFSGHGHYVFFENRGALELGWSYPLTRNVRLYTQLFTGYGETLIDYNHNQTRFGIGVSLNDVL